MGKTKQNADAPHSSKAPVRVPETKKQKGMKKRRHVFKQQQQQQMKAREFVANMNGKRQPRRHVTMNNGHAPGMFVRVNAQVSDDSDSESEIVQLPAQKRRRTEPPVVAATAAPPPPPPPPQQEEPKFNGPMYKIIRNGQVHRILVDPDRPGPSKEYEPLNSLVRNEMNLSDLSDEAGDFSEEMSDEELSEEEYEENYSDEVETGDSDHELDEELMHRIHGYYNESDENEFGTDSEDSEYRSDFDTDEEEDYYKRFMHCSESSDTDYDPGDDYVEDLYIPKGAAKTYSVDVMSLPFSPDNDEAQVVDVTEFFEKAKPDSTVADDASDDTDEAEENGITSSSSSTPKATSVIIESDTSSEALDDSTSSDDAEPADIVEDYKIFGSGKQRQLLLLKRSIFINGVLDVQLLAGHAQINGYELKRNVKKRVVSAKGYKYTNITPLVVESSQNGALTDDDDANFLKDYPDIEQIRKEFDSHRHALLILSKSKQSPSLKVVQKYTQRHLFPAGATKFFTDMQCKRPLVVPEAWAGIKVRMPDEEAADDTENDKTPDRIMAVGGKSVGKSTLVEHLVNKSLNHREQVLLVDLDVGQPILMMPQIVSATVMTEPILGVGTFAAADNPHLEMKTVMYGDIGVNLSPVRYLKCVKELIKHCEEKYAHLPWIINTMGFHKGLGLELIVGLIKIVHPTKVVQIQHKIENFNFKDLLTLDYVNAFALNMFMEELTSTPASTHNLHVIESVVKNGDEKQQGAEGTLSPVEKRTIMVLAHLGSILKDHHEWFTDVKPVACSKKDITIKVVEATCLTDAENASLVNGNLVYLCHHSKNCDIGECFGLGIVRAVNADQIFLLPAIVHDSIMQKVNTLVVANINLPVDVVLRQSTKVENAIPFVYNTENESAGTKKVNRCVDRNNSTTTSRGWKRKQPLQQ